MMLKANIYTILSISHLHKKYQSPTLYQQTTNKNIPQKIANKTYPPGNNMLKTQQILFFHVNNII
jgi:hypothetical protein